MKNILKTVTQSILDKDAEAQREETARKEQFKKEKLAAEQEFRQSQKELCEGLDLLAACAVPRIKANGEEAPGFDYSVRVTNQWINRIAPLEERSIEFAVFHPHAHPVRYRISFSKGKPVCQRMCSSSDWETLTDFDSVESVLALATERLVRAGRVDTAKILSL